MSKKQPKTPRDTETGFHVIIDDHVPTVRPGMYGIMDLDTVNPNAYFITSGDAVSKATVLDRDMWDAAGQARKKYGNSKNKEHQEFLKLVWGAAGRTRKFLNFLKSLRAEHIFLETEWRDHKLYCIPKDPRKKEPIGGDE